MIKNYQDLKVWRRKNRSHPQYGNSWRLMREYGGGSYDYYLAVFNLVLEGKCDYSIRPTSEMVKDMMAAMKSCNDCACGVIDCARLLVMYQQAGAGRVIKEAGFGCF